MDINKIIANHGKAMQERDTFSSILTDTYRYCIPSRNSWTTASQGSENDISIYNSHPVNATKNFASTIVNSIAPNGFKFFDLKAKKQLGQDDKEQFNKMITPISETLLDYLQSSNMYTALHESCIDLAAGTGGILLTYSGDDSNPLKFQSINMAKVSFSESSTGKIDNVYQEITDMPIDIAKACYPNCKFPARLESVSFLYATIYDESEKKYHTMILNKDDKEVWDDTVYNTNPFIIFRWSKLAGETWGRGVLVDNLASIKTANLMMADILTASQRVIAPPTVVYQNSIINPSNTDFTPNSIITVRPVEGVGNPITSLPFTGNLPFGIEFIDKFNAQLDIMLFNEPLGVVGQNGMTATEVSSRMQNYAIRIGSPYSRLQTELLSCLINRSIDILTSRGLIPAIPDIKLQFSSPISHLQNQVDFQKTLQAIQTIAQVSGNNAQQAIATSIDIARLPTWIANSLGADMSLFRTTEEVTTAMNALQKIAHQQQAMQQSSANPALGTRPVDTGVQGVSPV